MLTQTRLKELLYYDSETGVWTWRVTHHRIFTGDVAGSITNSHGYRSITIDQQSHLAHRLVFLYMTGEWPREDVDHQNLNREDNRWCNLREATRSENHANRRVRKDNRCGLKGVCLHKQSGLWMMQIKMNVEKRTKLFRTPEEAHAAYCAAAEKIHGEFARWT